MVGAPASPSRRARRATEGVLVLVHLLEYIYTYTYIHIALTVHSLCITCTPPQRNSIAGPKALGKRSSVPPTESGRVQLAESARAEV